MTGGYDERCAADLANVCEGRELAREDRAWLARAVTGAVRPNRDRPLWDLAHALAALARLTRTGAGRDLVTLVLDPQLARAEALRARFAEAGTATGTADARGLVLQGDAEGWRTTWSGLARLLALAEFVLTAEDLAHFSALSGWLDELVSAPKPEGAAFLAKRLARHLAAYRNAHLPLAPLERRFRAILGFLDGRRAFTDDDILGFWQAEMGGDERPGFRTVAEHFVTFEAVSALLGDLEGLAAAASLDAVEGWEGRLDASLGDLAVEPAESLAVLLAGIGDAPKILTGAERDDLADLLRLEPFHRTRPLTTLRAASFGRVQSGLANRLRRGGGGAEIAERVTCAEAETYRALADRVAALAAHLDRMLRIAAALRVPADAEGLEPEVRGALAAALTDLRRVRRAGFDDPDRVTAGFAAADAALLRLADEIGRLGRALAGLAGERPLEAAFAADRAIFARTLAEAYAAEAA